MTIGAVLLPIGTRNLLHHAIDETREFLAPKRVAYQNLRSVLIRELILALNAHVVSRSLEGKFVAFFVA